MPFSDKFENELLFFDGAMGTLLQAKGLKAGELPEGWNLEKPACIYEIHTAYLNAGCDIIKTNTFGANKIKTAQSPYSAAEMTRRGVEIARRAVQSCGREAFVALDIGPTGKLLSPFGELAFEDAAEAFAETVKAGTEAGADLILIETMSDLYELKAAVLAAKENSHLPILATMIFDENEKLLTGADLETALFTAEALGVDGVGFNCGLGPLQMLPLVKHAREICSLPLIVNPNAGLPEVENGKTVYRISPMEFAEAAAQIADCGVGILGGCCGTSPAHLQAVIRRCKGKPCGKTEKKAISAVTSYSKTVRFGERPVLIGERINPTGKKQLKEALRAGDTDYLLSEAVTQADCGADILDVNAGLPEIDEPTVLRDTVRAVQSVTDLPLQIDTADPVAMEKALRLYNGKPMLNSANGKQSSMHTVFPLAKKYGGAVVCLTLDENGIPETAAGRIEIAKRMLSVAAEYGIDKKDLIIDPLCMTVSTGKDNAKVALEAVQYIREALGVHTVLGVSNISFGLPERDSLNAAFFTLAMEKGLSAGIINPKSREMMNAYYAYCALTGLDENFVRYMARNVPAPAQQAENRTADLYAAIVKGLKAEAERDTGLLLKTEAPLSVIQNRLMPALNEVGEKYSAGTFFLPQLLMSADAAKAAFSVLRGEMQKSGAKEQKKGKILLATVRGDIHDIGKNIVKVLLENYGYEILDLGKDVPPEKIVQTVLTEDLQLVGLSALMTTTVVSMEETVRQLNAAAPSCRVMVGGAVLTQKYAESIGANFYAKSAMDAVHYAAEVFKEQNQP